MRVMPSWVVTAAMSVSMVGSFGLVFALGELQVRGWGYVLGG